MEQELEETRFTFYVVRAISVKFGLHASNTNVDKQNEETNKFTYNYILLRVHKRRQRATAKTLTIRYIHFGQSVVVSWLSYFVRKGMEILQRSISYLPPEW